MGAVTVVLSSNQTDARLDPEGLIRAITQKPFIALAIIYAVGAVTFVGLSSSRIGREWVFIDVGACALFGMQNYPNRCYGYFNAMFQEVSLYSRPRHSARF